MKYIPATHGDHIHSRRRNLKGQVEGYRVVGYWRDNQGEIDSILLNINGEVKTVESFEIQERQRGRRVEILPFPALGCCNLGGEYANR